ncbi:MAG: YfhO family protein [bacterium]
MARSDNHSAAPSSLAPRFAMGWAALTYALATLALAYPALSGQFLVSLHSDQYIAGFAFRDFAAQSLRAGHGMPHWNPFMFGGLPYVGAMHGDIFYPTALLRLILPTDVGMTWGFIIHTFLAGLFTYMFLRAWGLSFLPALVGGLAYMLGGPIASYASPGHDGKLFLGALLPAALFLLLRGFRDGRNWAWGAFAIVVGLGWLSPHPQLLEYLLLTAGSFALYLAYGTDSTGAALDRQTAFKRLGFALAAVVVGTAIGAIQYLPVREYVAWSPRAAGHDYAIATSYSFPIIELVNMYVPQFTGMLDKYWGQNSIHLHSEYIGGPILMLATAAFGGAAHRKFRWFWVGTLIVALLWMLGGSTPFFQLIYAIVPGTKFFRAPSTIIYVFSFATSVLAALGTERILAKDLSRNAVLGWLGFGVLLALLAAAGVLNGFAEAAARGVGATLAEQRGYDLNQVSAVMVQRADANTTALTLGAWRSMIFLALVVGIVLAYVREKVTVQVFSLALTVLIGADLWTIARQYWMFSPPAKVLYASDPAVEFLKHEPEPGRVLVRALSDSGLVFPDPYFGNDSQGKGTGLMVHGIRSVTGYHGNELGRYDAISQAVGAGNAPATMSPTFWSHENVRYLYTNAALADSQVKRLVGPIKNSAGSTVYLYRLPGDNPYAWLAAGKTTAPDSALLPVVLDSRFDARRLAVFSDSNTLKVIPPTSLPEPLQISTATSEMAPGHATIALSAPSPEGSTLVVSENYYPGWHAMVDGKAQPVYRADYNLIGVPLPAGARRVELSFRDSAVDAGKGITLAAAFVALLALAGGVMLDRRRIG